MFTQHPEDAEESYFEHMKVSGKAFYFSMVAAFCLFWHAIFPGFFTFSGSSLLVHARYGVLDNNDRLKKAGERIAAAAAKELE
jgi:hypothetical protein